MAVVYLSPSVQEWNVGYGRYGTEEYRMNRIADVVAYELDRHGVEVVRNAPEQTLTQVVAQSNQIAPTVHVAIHSNASATGTARGPEVYVHKFGGASQALANDIYAQLVRIAPTDGLGVKAGYTAFDGKGYYELRRTAAPAVLVEVAFHDNPDDAAYIIYHSYEIGVAIAQGILTYLGIPYRADSADRIQYLRAKYNAE